MKKCLGLLLALLLLGGGAAHALAPEPEGLYAGMDVSSYQGTIDFAAAKGSGIQAVYIRAGEGADFTDPFLTQHTEGARRAGLRWGYYHYVTAADAAQAREQAAFFARLIQGRGYDCRPAMDFEAYDGMTRAEANTVALAFLQELETLTGVTPLLYSDAWAAESLWDPALGAYPLWCADWGPAEPSVGTDIWSGWAGFQYTDKGSVPGVTGVVDRDKFTSAIFLTEDETVHSRAGGGVTHTVVWGDTLWCIALRYGSTVEAIVRANGIPDPNLIYPGQVFTIPV